MVPVFGKTVLVVMCCASLAACAKKSPCDKAAPADRVKAADLMVSCLNTLATTPVAKMPTTGTANYNGFFTGTVDTGGAQPDNLLGDAALNANFGAGTFGGSVTNIDSTDVGALTGALNLNSGNISGSSFNANIAGALGYGTDTLTISGTTAGLFLGDKANAVVGAVTGTGTLTSNGYVGNASGALIGRK